EIEISGKQAGEHAASKNQTDSRPRALAGDARLHRAVHARGPVRYRRAPVQVAQHVVDQAHGRSPDAMLVVSTSLCTYYLSGDRQISTIIGIDLAAHVVEAVVVLLDHVAHVRAFIDDGTQQDDQLRFFGIAPGTFEGIA